MNYKNKLIQRAWDDSEFKKQLINNPVKTIEAEIGKENINIPSGKTLVVLDEESKQEVDRNDSKHVYFSIPKKFETVELAEEELNLVAGGFTYIPLEDDSNDTECVEQPVHHLVIQGC